MAIMLAIVPEGAATVFLAVSGTGFRTSARRIALIARRGFEPLQSTPHALKRISGASLIMGRLGIE
jgi:hypothetical protein